MEIINAIDTICLVKFNSEYKIYFIHNTRIRRTQYRTYFHRIQCIIVKIETHNLNRSNNVGI